MPVVAAMEAMMLGRKEVWVVAGSWCKVESVGSSSVTVTERRRWRVKGPVKLW